MQVIRSAPVSTHRVQCYKMDGSVSTNSRYQPRKNGCLCESLGITYGKAILVSDEHRNGTGRTFGK